MTDTRRHFLSLLGVTSAAVGCNIVLKPSSEHILADLFRGMYSGDTFKVVRKLAPYLIFDGGPTSGRNINVVRFFHLFGGKGGIQLGFNNAELKQGPLGFRNYSKPSEDGSPTKYEYWIEHMPNVEAYNELFYGEVGEKVKYTKDAMNNTWECATKFGLDDRFNAPVAWPHLSQG